MDDLVGDPTVGLGGDRGQPFVRLSGGGNDFLALVEPAQPPAAPRIAAWCRRGLALGADGLFVLLRAAPTAAAERRQPPAVVMDYFNADGYPAELCLNGTRCAARLAFALGWNDGEDLLTVRTGAGEIPARQVGETRIALELPPLAETPRLVSLDLDGEVWEGFFATVGVPHWILTWKGTLAAAPLATVAPRLRAHPLFGQAGTNIDFVRWVEPGFVELRTFERGVEAETLACGTGAVAVAAVGLLTGRAKLPLRVLTGGGFELEVDGEAGERLPLSWRLTGDARIVATGRIAPEAEQLPDPPAWRPAPDEDE